MQFTSAQRGSHEQVIGTFYMSNNEWVTDENSSSANWGLNLKGFMVFLDLKLSNYSSVTGVQPGMACAIPSTSGNASSYIAPLGILLDDMIVGSRKLTGQWVRVLQYGHCDRIVCYNAGAIDTGDHILYVYGANSGKVGGITFNEYYNSYRTLTGVVTISMDGNAGTAVVNLAGSTVTSGAMVSTWIGAPQVYGVPTGGAPGLEGFQFVGYHYEGDVPVQLPEYLNGDAPKATYADIRVVKGFVNCMGGIRSW